jgi:7-carboxy-7-deazaguanine synthase
MLPVNELFETIQGEASWTGTPSVFIRLQGCDVGCAFCDTKYTWPVNPEREVALSAMLSKLDDDDKYSLVGIDTLVAMVKRYSAKHVVITGGEPCTHDLLPLTTRLIEQEGRSVQIETSGTAEIRCHHRTWVTVSPKFHMPGGKEVQIEMLNRADEIKMPVGRPADIAQLTTALGQLKQRTSRDIPIWLQPLSMNKKATELCIAIATANNWKLSVQTHRFIGVR